MGDRQTLLHVARGLLPPGTGLGTSDPRAGHPGFPGEAAAGLPDRQTEFRAGRAALRLAMAEIGAEPHAVPMGEDRAPVWPAGLTGSITHTHLLCLACVAPVSVTRGLGLDLELATPLEDDLRPTILRAEEMGATALEAKLIFTAKEAAYKAQYGLSRCLFDFQVLSVRLDGQQFTARFSEEITPFPQGTLLKGHWAEVCGHFLCVVTL